jgi:hypothetical protein
MCVLEDETMALGRRNCSHPLEYLAARQTKAGNGKKTRDGRLGRRALGGKID